MSLETNSPGNVDNSVQADANASDQAGMISSLGDALAGVSLGFHTSTPTAGSSTAVTGNGAGWGGFSNPDASRNSFARSTVHPGGSGSNTNLNSPNDVRQEHGIGASSGQPMTNPGSSSHVVDPTTPDAKLDIDLFLSRSPSQMLGDDVFKLSTKNLSGLTLPHDHNSLPRSTSAAGVAPVSTTSYDSATQQRHQPRRESPASNVTGATASTASRSTSPYETGTVGTPGGRTIQAYHAYDHEAKTEGVNGAAPVYHPIIPGPVAPPGPPSYQDHGPTSAPGLNATYKGGVTSSPAINTMGFGGNASSQYDVSSSPYNKQQPDSAQVAVQQQQPQVLYMAMPTPDGRGQVLQPVQIMQMPGKQFAYVIPGADGMPSAMPSMLGAAQPMMIMPTVMPQQGGGPMVSPVNPMTQPPGMQGTDMVGGFMSAGGLERNSPGQNKNIDGDITTLGGYHASPADAGGYATNVLFGGSDNYVQGGMGGDGTNFMNPPTDPTLASLYATPQRPPLDALLGQVRRLFRDQVGCRLVQQALDEEGPMAATLILNEGLPFWGEAMVDPFGNYLFQKILEKITVVERIMLVKSVSPRLVNASLSLHGTRSVQKIVELCSMDEENKRKEPGGKISGGTEEETAADVLTKALAPAAARLCIDSHGNHVIQRILLKLGHKHSKFIFDAVAESVGDVARHRHGCCVIQRCLDSQPGSARSNLVHRIVEKSLELMQDAYGNYVVQYVLDVCSDDDVHAVCESVVGKVSVLAIQKFSSNVMEKCLERCTDHIKEHYMQELSDPERIRELMMDPFGNYVVQRALSVASHAQAVRLVEAMRPHLISQIPGTPNGQRSGGVRNTAGGRRIMAKICRRFPNFNLHETGSNDEIYSQNRRHHSNHQNQSATLAPVYGMAQLSPAPVQILQHQHFQPQQHQQQRQLYPSEANPNNYATNSLALNPMTMGGFQTDQRQHYYDLGSDAAYDLGSDAGYFQQNAPFGQGYGQ